MANWFCSSVGWTNVTAWAASTAYSVGDIRRQAGSVTVGLERVFRCTTAGTSGAAESSITGSWGTNWLTTSVTKGATCTDNTAVWTEITGSATYNTTSFAAPFARLQTPLTSSWAAAGDTVYVASNHAETASATGTSLTSPGTVNSPVKVICIATTFSNPPVQADITTGASVTMTGSNNINISGGWWCYGLKFQGTTGTTNINVSLAGGSGQVLESYFENCVFKAGSASTSRVIFAGDDAVAGGGKRHLFVNCNIDTPHATDAGIYVSRSHCLFIGGTWVTATTTAINKSSSGRGGILEFRNYDFSAQTSGKNIVDLSGTVTSGEVRLINCKLTSGVNVTTGTLASHGNGPVHLINCDHGTINYREEHYFYEGSIVQDATQYRTGGASDGTTPKAWKVVSLAGCDYVRPLYCPDIYQWVDSTGSKTFTIYFASGGTLNDTDIGFELEYLGSSATPLGTFSTTVNGVLDTATAWATDAVSTWNGAGVGTKQSMSLTKTINLKGLVRVRPFVIKASATVYIDPIIVVT